MLGAAQANDNTVGTVGVAPDADARVTKIYDGTTGNSQHRAWEVHAASAIDDWAAQAEVMTISYSTKITSPNPPATFVGLHDAIQNAYYQHGVLFTASTGNQGRSDYYAYPAQFAEVIGVGGSDRNDAYTLNNYAPGNVELAAPARDVLTVCKGGAIGEYDGTSFATPMVAGAVMLLREAHPTWSADQVRQRLRDTAVPMANATRSGAGRLDVAAALGIGSPPPDPLAVSLSGPTFLWEGDQGTWTAQVSNASGSVTYRWYKGGALVRTHTTSSTSDAYSTFATFPGFTLEVEVESGGDVAQSSLVRRGGEGVWRAGCLLSRVRQVLTPGHRLVAGHLLEGVAHTARGAGPRGRGAGTVAAGHPLWRTPPAPRLGRAHSESLSRDLARTRKGRTAYSRPHRLRHPIPRACASATAPSSRQRLRGRCPTRGRSSPARSALRPPPRPPPVEWEAGAPPPVATVVLAVGVGAPGPSGERRASRTGAFRSKRPAPVAPRSRAV